MADDLRGVIAVVTGSFVIAGGSTIAGINAFDGQVGWVMLGFVIFTAGYAISQRGVHADGAPALSGLSGDSASTLVLRIGLIVAGLAGIAYGVTAFSQTILHPSLENAILSGISSIGGYMLAHVGVNQTGLGWSYFSQARQATAFIGRGRDR